MIELRKDNLVFTFPEVHPDARLTIEFQRTLRIPDDETVHRLPPGLGAFPLMSLRDLECALRRRLPRVVACSELGLGW